MKAIGVIPARWGSTRFEGKVLTDIAGKPMIRHVWERAKQSRKLDDVIVATDHLKIKAAVESFGGKAVMTSPDHVSGSDRIAEAVEHIVCDCVVNIQGDEPLIHPEVIDDLVDALIKSKDAPMATVICKITSPEELDNPNVVKVVKDSHDFALYFSRSRIPFSRDNAALNTVVYYKHLGLYAYRKDFILKFSHLSKTPLEESEKLEQLRVLEHGYKIKTVVTQHDTVGVDTPEDLRRVEALMKGRK